MSREVKINIGTTADTSGVDKAKAAIQGLGADAKNASVEIAQADDKLAALQEEMRGKFADAGKRLEALRAEAATTPPLPGNQDPASGVGDLKGAAALSAASLAIIVKVAGDMKQAFDQGAKAAGELNEQLRTLPADKAAELRNQLGPVAELLDANSDAIAAFAARSREAEQATQNFWIAMAARAIPSLNELREATGSIDLQPLGEGLGNVVGGGAAVASDGLRGLNYLLGENKTTALGLGEVLLSTVNPSIAQTIALLNARGAAEADASAAAQAARRQANEGTDEISARAFTEAEISKARIAALEAQLPAEKRLAAVRERQAQLIEEGAKGSTDAVAEAAALEKVAVSIQAQIDKQAEADRIKQESAAAAVSAYETQVQTTEAVAAGNTVEAERLRYAQDYAAALKSANGDEGLASRMAVAQAKQRTDAAAARDAERLAKAAAAEEDLATTLAIAEARSRGDEESAARIKNEADIRREQASLREKGLTDEDRLNQLANARRSSLESILAEKNKEREADIAIAEAKAVGNKEEAAKLEWLKLYQALQAKGYSEDQARRAANAAAMQAAGADPNGAPYARPGTNAPGELFAGTNRRRGATESDAFGENALNLKPGESLLDQYKANQSRAVGAINGKSILPADPTSNRPSIQGGGSPGNPAAPGDQGSAQGLASAAESLGKSEDIAPVGKQINSALDRLSSAITNKFKDLAALKQQLTSVAAKVEALAKKI